jgi:hypothetical protein
MVPLSTSHCTEPHSKIQNKYSQKRNCTTTVPNSTFVCLWAIYIFPRSICLFSCRKYVDRSREYINRSQTDEGGNLDWGRAIPRKGIHKWRFRCSTISPLAPVEDLSASLLLWWELRWVVNCVNWTMSFAFLMDTIITIRAINHFQRLTIFKWASTNLCIKILQKIPRIDTVKIFCQCCWSTFILKVHKHEIFLNFFFT